MNNPLYLQYGCGRCAPPGWKNYDASPTVRFERLPLIGKLYTKNRERFPENIEYGDIVKGLPVSPGSCAAIYCSHVLEHLALDDFRSALKNTFVMLQPGGTFRMVLPDLEYLARQYINDPSPDASLIFMKETYLGHEKRERGLKGLLSTWLGNSQHLWMWDIKSMVRELEKVGFIEIRKAKFGDSSDAMFADVEDENNWVNCLGVECNKPIQNRVFA